MAVFRTKVAQVCVEALFEPSARRLWKLLPRRRLQKRALSSYLAWLEPGDFEEFSSETFIAGSAALIVLVFCWRIGTQEPRSRLDPTRRLPAATGDARRPLHSSVDANKYRQVKQ